MLSSRIGLEHLLVGNISGKESREGGDKKVRESVLSAVGEGGSERENRRGGAEVSRGESRGVRRSPCSKQKEALERSIS